MNYYNEFDPFAAAWLRELIKAEHIPQGEVDERDIWDVCSVDLKGFTQCHFFAGIGGWSYALRLAKWPDDCSVWTGSCPCQPFSAAGKREGITDERHLWPALYHLIAQSRPETFFGEQVASKDGLAWLDTVSSDLEGANYTVGSADICAAGFGAPHIRQRLYFVADSGSQPTRRRLRRSAKGIGKIIERTPSQSERSSSTSFGMADPNGRNSRPEGLQRSGQHGQFEEDGCSGSSVVNPSCEQMGLPGCSRESRGTNVALGDTSSSGLPERERNGRVQREALESSTRQASISPSHTNGFWSGADWIYCRDEKYRPVEAGTFPLAHGIAHRVGKLRGYGNAIVAPVAQAFIESYLEVTRGRC